MRRYCARSDGVNGERAGYTLRSGGAEGAREGPGRSGGAAGDCRTDGGGAGGGPGGGGGIGYGDDAAGVGASTTEGTVGAGMVACAGKALDASLGGTCVGSRGMGADSRGGNSCRK
jgi:hypothetical protein